MRAIVLPVFLGLCVGPCAVAMADDERAAEPKDKEQKAVDQGGELSMFWVPYGGAYVRAAWGVQFRYDMPLIKKPGVLWETTKLTLAASEVYGYTNNRLSAYAEVTPIAFFKLRVTAAHDYMLRGFDGGIRVLTTAGQMRLSAGMVERGNANAVDWVDGVNNSDVFTEPVYGGGLRLLIQPTLQAKVGPIGVQYTLTADINHYSVDGYSGDDIFHDPHTYSLRELSDWGISHQGTVAYIAELSGELIAGLTSRYYAPRNIDNIESLSLEGTFFYKADWDYFGERWHPWGAAQIGTLLSDPMHEREFSWVLVFGADVRLF